MGTINKYQVVEGAPRAAKYVDNRVLAAATAETCTPPADAKVVLINSDVPIWVRWDGSAAAVPGSDVTDGTGSELEPGFRSLEGISTFSIIASSAAKVSLAYYK